MSINFFKIFKAGTFTDMAGKVHSFSKRDLEQTALFYTNQRPKAPLVLGHPADNGPELGTVLKLSTQGDAMFAEADVSEKLVNLVRSGQYKYVSASFSPGYLAGSWILRHVGMLGATPPAVKGLGALAFSEHLAFCEALQSAFIELPGLNGAVSFSEFADGGTRYQVHREKMHLAIKQMVTQYPEFSYLEAAMLIESMINNSTKAAARQ